MTRPRHAMRAHPLRSPGVVVGVPVAAAVAFGAHAVLGITPLADQHGAPTTSSASSAAPTAAPAQGYGLATAPPPTTLGLLSAPGTAHGATSDGATSGGATSDGGAAMVPITGSPAAHHVAARSVPIAPAAGVPAPPMMTFTPAHAAPAAGGAAAPAAPVGAPHADPAPAERAAAPTQGQDDGTSSDEGSSGGSVLGVDLGVAKVSLLSFGD